MDFQLVPTLAKIIVCGALDRLRGSGIIPGGKTAFKVLYALFVFGLIEGHGWPFLLSFSLGFVVGESIGWGEPLGAFIGSRELNEDRLEWWQIGPLAESPGLAVLFRGLLWGLCTLPACLFSLRSVLIFIWAITLAFFLAALICRLWARHDDYAWEAHEFVRGVLLAIFIFLGTTYG
jgi:hypothetical protein